jgi:orotate phosphoribosyltransferase
MAVDQQIMEQDYKRDLLEVLYTRSFMYDPDKKFKLASGVESDVYIDAKKTALNSMGMELVGFAIFQELKNDPVDAVGGLTLGADAVAYSTALIGTMRNKMLDAFVVRKEPKSHGTQKWIEGDLRKDAWAIVIEDVVTTGSSAITAVERLREAGVTVNKVIALIDREEGGRENIEKKTNCKFVSIFTKSDLLEFHDKVKKARELKEKEEEEMI